MQVTQGCEHECSWHDSVPTDATPTSERGTGVLVGIDVQSIDEVAASMREFGSRYVHRIYTDVEVEQCGDDPMTSARGLAARFAAKEAVMKILDVRDDVPAWKDIAVRRTASGRPEVILQGVAAQLARRQGLGHVSLSLSHTDSVAAAAVVAQVSGRSERLAS